MAEKRLLWENKKEKVPREISTKNRIDNIKVLENVYWEEYYELSDIHYEWNNGFLEEKPVSDYRAYLMFLWFVELLRHFLTVYPIGKMIGLEMGFRLQLPHKATIRKPDTGIILNTNPVEINESDNKYSGIVDLCVEMLSDSNRCKKCRSLLRVNHNIYHVNPVYPVQKISCFRAKWKKRKECLK